MLGARFSGQASAALYAVSSDVEGAAMVKVASARSHRAVVDMLATAQKGADERS